ncbi:MAG: hypothetical protein ACOC35_01050 [Promethearchaeia archaeon]
MSQEKKMEAIGMVFLYDGREGKPKEVSKKLSEYFGQITENVVKTADLMTLKQLKDIIEQKAIYYAGINKNFSKVLNDPQKIGQAAWEIFYKHTKKEASEDIQTLVYDGAKAPWKFTLLVAVLYEPN